MKKMLMIVAIVCFSASALSAGLISFGFGAHVINPIPIDGEGDAGSIEDWLVGGEVRLGVLFAEATVNGLYDADSEQLSGIVTIGTSMSLFGLVHAGIGFGPALSLSMANGEVDWSYQDPSGAVSPAQDLGDAVDRGLFHYRGHADMKVGRVSLGMTLQVPSDGYTFANNDVLLLTPDWEQAQLGASLLFWLF